MNIFEELDILLKSTNKINEASTTTGVSYSDVPIASEMETAKQAEEYIRKYFINQLIEGGGGGEGPDDPMPIDPTPPPPPVIKRRIKSGGSSSKPKNWENAEVEWDDDEFIKRLELEAEALDEIEDGDDDGDDDYDDFLDKSKKGAGGGMGDDDNDDDGLDEDERDRDDEDDEDDDKSSTSSSKKKSKGKKKTSGGDDDEDNEDDDDADDGDSMSDKEGKEGDDGDDDSMSGEKGEKSGKKGKKGKDGDDDGDDDGYGGDDDKSELESSIEDALEKLAERNESDKEDIEELRDMLRDENAGLDEIEERGEKITGDKARSKEKYDKLKSLVGRLEKTPSKEEIEKEIEASKLSPEEIQSLKDSTVEGAYDVTPPSDSELDALKREAMVEMEKKCKGHSSLKTSIIYHSLKTAKIENQDWEKIVEKILKDKSINSGEFEEKVKKAKLGDKNHLWRHDVRYTKEYKKGGSDTQSIYCFVDYSGSVKSRPGLIVTFLGKILEVCNKLEYTNLTVYTFADDLSLPRVINRAMLKSDGYEKTLANTLAYFDDKSNDVGGAIENFAEVGFEVNRIKSKDKNAVIFIFGDGVWTFYGNTNPPTRLVEICPHWIKDIVPFVFYDDESTLGYLGKEISLLKDVVGIKDVVVTKTSRMKE